VRVRVCDILSLIVFRVEANRFAFCCFKSYEPDDDTYVLNMYESLCCRTVIVFFVFCFFVRIFAFV